MLQTLIKLGSQLSHNRGEWDDIIDYQNIQIISSVHSIFPYNPFEAGNGNLLPSFYLLFQSIYFQYENWIYKGKGYCEYFVLISYLFIYLKIFIKKTCMRDIYLPIFAKEKSHTRRKAMGLLKLFSRKKQLYAKIHHIFFMPKILRAKSNFICL